MLKDYSVANFVREVSSSSPAPGGGSAAALVGSQSAGLISMYCKLSQNREKLGSVVDVLQEIGEEAQILMEKLLEAIDKDSVAFNQVMEAYRLPKGNDQEIIKRKKTIQEAAINAAETPMDTARASLRLLNMIKNVAGKGNPSAITDLGVANLLAMSAIIGACYNVSINLGMIKDEIIISNYKREVGDVLNLCKELFEENRAIIEENIQ